MELLRWPLLVHTNASQVVNQALARRSCDCELMDVKKVQNKFTSK